MSSCEVDFSMLEESEKEVKMIKECVLIRETMSDWLQLGHRVEIMVVELQIKIILELNDTALLESADQLYYDCFSIISNKYGSIQTQYENLNERFDLLEQDSKRSAEMESVFQSFTKKWEAVKDELNSDLQDCLKRVEKLLDEFKQKSKDARGNREV